MKIALVHDYLVQYGGAERVLEAFTELFPYAPIYTLIHDKDAMHGAFEDKLIYTSFLQNMPLARRNHRLFPPLMPLAIEQFDFSKYDVVLSDSSSYAKGIITRPEDMGIVERYLGPLFGSGRSGSGDSAFDPLRSMLAGAVQDFLISWAVVALLRRIPVFARIT